MVQRTGYGGSSRVRMSDPTEPTQRERRGATVQSFMDSVLSPFVQCVSPPLQACVAPAVPWQPRHVRRPVSPVVSVTPVSGSSYVNHQFGENDILCGKGRTSICHSGNQRFLEIIEANRGEYARATRKQKVHLANAIVDLIRNAQPPGRFLLKDLETGRWYDIGRSRSFEKTSQSLRDFQGAKSKPAPAGYGRPSLVIPEHLKHIYQVPDPTEYRNPPHSTDARQGGHSHPVMYMHPLSSASSFEMVSPCSSNLSDTHFSTPHQHIMTHPMVTPSSRPGSPIEVANSPPPRPSPTSPPQDLHKGASKPAADRAPVAEAPSKTFAFRQPSSLTGIFDTPVDGHSPTASIVPPSAVRRNRHASGEDGLAALSAAAFLKLDDIE